MEAEAKRIEEAIVEYARDFLRAEYGAEALEKLRALRITVVDDYDWGGLTEVSGCGIKIAVKRDVAAGRLTATTKLIVRHEIGHALDADSPAFPEFDQEILHEKIAWRNAKPKTAAENWYKNLSIRTHVDPLKMQTLGFPRPENKVSKEKLARGTVAEVRRMRKTSFFVDRGLAERFAMANLVENPNYYGSAKIKT